LSGLFQYSSILTDSKQNNTYNSFHRSDSIVLLIAFLFRVAHLLFWSKTVFFTHPFLDELYHHRWAQWIASGNLIFPTAFFRAPLYPYLLGLIYSGFGSSPLPARIVQILIGTLGCAIIAIFARKAFRDWRIGFLAGLLAATSPIPILFESRLLLDWLLIPLTGLIFLFAIKIRENEKWIYILLFGFFGGLFAITRPNILIVFPVILLWLILQKKKSWFKILLVGLLGFIIPILPVTVHNLSHGDCSLISTQGGLNLYLGNNSETDGITPILPGYNADWTIIDAWQLAKDEAGEELSPSDMDKFYLKKAFNYISNNFKQELVLIGRKISYLLSPVEHGNNGSPEFFKRFSPVLKWPVKWGLLLIITLLAIPITYKHNSARMLFLWLIAYSATIVLFFVNSRFRLPLLPAMYVLGAAGVIGFCDLIREHRYKKLILPILCAIIALLIMFTGDSGKLSEHGKAESWFNMGNLYLRDGQLEKADSAFAKAQEIMPGIRKANLNRGVIAYRNHKTMLATDYFSREIAVNGDKVAAWTNIGVMERLKGNLDLALKAGEKSVLDESGDVSAFYNYAQTLIRTAEYDSAYLIAEKGLSIDSLDLRLLLVAGAALIKNGDTTRAKTYFERATISSTPEIIRLYSLRGEYSVECGQAASDNVLRGYAEYNLGLIYTNRGQISKAIIRLKKAVELAPNLAEAWAGLGTALESRGDLENALDAFKRANSLGMNTPGIFYNIGLIYARLTEYKKAKTMFYKALELDPHFQPAQEKLEILNELAKQGKILLE